MKKILFVFTALLSIPAFSEEVDFLESHASARNRFFCYYRDSATRYLHGAGAPDRNTARTRAYWLCRQALDRNDTPWGSCRFEGCRTVR